MDDGCINPISRFKPSSPENPSFFKSLKEKQSEEEIRNRLEDVLGPLSDSIFNKIKHKARLNFEHTVIQYLDNPPIDLENNYENLDKKTKLFDKVKPEITSTAGYGSDQVVNGNQKNSLEAKKSDLTSDEAADALPEQKHSSTTNLVKQEEPSECPNLWKDDRRFIGSLQAEVWCTRSGRNLIQFNEKLRIDRAGTGSLTGSATTKQKDDVMVRFYNSEGLYFARAQESDARFMSVLIDSNVCHFEATVIYAEPILRLGSTVFVQVDCYMKRSAFANTASFSVELNPKKKKIVDESKETREEKLIRLRQLALINIFNRLGLIESEIDMTQAVIDANKAQSKHNTPPPAHTPPQHTPSSPLSSAGAGDDQEEEGQVLNEDQLELFYNDTVATSKSAEGNEVEPSETFGLSLFPYQKRGLSWMLDREKVLGDVDETSMETHPLWTELKWPEGDPFWANLNSGELSLTRPTLALRSRGGILADEMGLGKTISTLALIHSATNESKFHSTLVVAPMSLLSQWESEIQKAAKTPHDCSCFVYYGNATSNSLRTTLSEFLTTSGFAHRIVVTTYGMISSEYKQRHLFKSGGIFNTEFDRIILDEAHVIKNRSTQTAKACFDLRGQRRWVLTGTPVVNRLEDLYSLVRFIGIEPWNNFTFWRAFITEQFQKTESREKAMKTVQAVVTPICLRRTKAMKDPATGKFLVELPNKNVEIQRIHFNEDEKALYSHLYARVRESVQVKVMDGTASSKYSTILTLLLRLRQVCCHPLLLRSSTITTENEPSLGSEEESITKAKRFKTGDGHSISINDSNGVDDLKLDLTEDIESLLKKFTATPSIEYTAESLKRLIDCPLEDEECPICSENQVDPILTECLHSACRDCLLSHIDYLKKRGDNAVCHICRAPIDSSRLIVVDREAKKLKPLNQGIQSSKVRALITSLRKAHSNGFGKAVVFSQFTSFLDLIEANLKEAGFPVYRFDGSMSQVQRAAAVVGFKSSKKQNSVLLLSQKAGGVGLNLVVANHAYLMDPWWNFANESQAIDRIHRMGQKDNVNVTRFIIQGSIEERMLKIQDRKRALSNLVTEEERRAETLENIRLLLELHDNHECY